MRISIVPLLVLCFFVLQTVCSVVEASSHDMTSSSVSKIVKAGEMGDQHHQHGSTSDCPECQLGSCHHCFVLKSFFQVLPQPVEGVSYAAFAFLYQAPFNKSLKRPPIA